MMNGKFGSLGVPLVIVLALVGCNGDGSTPSPSPSPSPTPTPTPTPSPGPTSRYSVEGDCVTDNLTGLMWARNANLPAGDNASTQPVTGKRTWQQALDFANNLELCGFSDWRLPNRLELRSHIDHQIPINAIHLTNSGFLNVGSQVSFDYFYWSSTTWSSSRDGVNTSALADIVSFQFGAVRPEYKTAVFYVWPVRTGSTVQTAPGKLPVTGQTTCSDTDGVTIDCANTGQDGEHQAGVAWPSPRFTVGTGEAADCVTDNLTGLMWVRAPNNLSPASANWEAADTTANDLSLCGYSDWRLPDVRELETLATNGVPGGASYLNDQGFVGVQETNYWTSTSRAYWGERDPTQLPAWTGELDGNLFHEYSKASAKAIWPVRGGL